MIYIAILFLSILSAIFGRAGGMGKDPGCEPKWIPVWMRESAVRDWLCPVCCLVPVIMINPSWWIILAYFALFGSLTTYYDTLFGYDNFWFAGFIAGISGFFLIYAFPWWIILIRALVLAIGWGVINLIIGKGNPKFRDGTEELVRYGFLSLSTVIFLIP